MEYLRGLAAAVKPIHPGVGAAEERQEYTTRERCEHRAAGGSAVAAGLRPGQAKEVWHGSRRSTPQPLERRRAEASSSANCSHFCSHLANLRPNNPVTARLLKPTTASLLSSRSLVRIQQGAFLERSRFKGNGCKDQLLQNADLIRSDPRNPEAPPGALTPPWNQRIQGEQAC